eukprot:CAMPEP_0115749942 /NCGR_PEP_ID=MMETSP0272-20121206/94459_1 /TAXON_ID=71861 /ORGANISM="Scrippsiella trochoidea, Strain CCMP3099" /LENGTH=42 /DNA_ID= /DNA_START= /DNA_END= /DNA_ORIENTATION=
MATSMMTSALHRRAFATSAKGAKPSARILRGPRWRRQADNAF